MHFMRCDNIFFTFVFTITITNTCLALRKIRTQKDETGSSKTEFFKKHNVKHTRS